MENKYCKSCDTSKDLDSFYNSKNCKDGKDTYCISCRKAKRESRASEEKVYQKEYRLLHKDRRNAGNKAFRENNPNYFQNWRNDNLIKCSHYNRQYKKDNPEKVKEIQRRLQKTYPQRYSKYASDYRARKLNATPEWLSEEQNNEILLVYELARDCSLTSGLDYHVDHIVPLKGKNICGLHVPWNLQVLPAHLNRSKSNKF
tara:strand:- start:2265 stop:2867 length:603 start_codon:yes stop_codon:yes gene_type:complete